MHLQYEREQIELTSVSLIYTAIARIRTGPEMKEIDAERMDGQRPRPGLQSWQQWQYSQAGIADKLNSHSSGVQTLCPPKTQKLHSNDKIAHDYPEISAELHAWNY